MRQPGHPPTNPIAKLPSACEETGKPIGEKVAEYEELDFRHQTLV